MTVTVTWLGQSGFVLSGDATTVVIDPFLSPNELRLADVPPPSALPDLIDVVLATHGHGDHLDLPGLAQLVAGGTTVAQLVVPEPHVAAARAVLGGVEIVGVQPGARLTAGAATIAVVPACHGVTVADGYSEGHDLDPRGTPHVGYVVTLAGTAIYHSGDTIDSVGIQSALASMTIDVAVLPVNGRDAEREARGIVGNLNAGEAVALAGELGARCLIPCHYEMIRGNTSDVGDVLTAARRAGDRFEVLTPIHYQAVTINAGARR